jgi:hypothetical protein
VGSLPAARLRADLQASEGLGMGATRVEERVNSAFGLSVVTPIHFEVSQSIPYGGVLFLLPFLIESGLMSYHTHYPPRSGYYDFDALFLTLAFLYLLRIKSVEQSKLYNPGELGKLIGYDRIPEVKKLRGMIKELTVQDQSRSWGESLSRQWIEEQDSQLYYVDGHVQVYHGYLAELGKKHVSRQRLCLPGMMEFWVNSAEGLPFFFITAEVNEKMIAMLKAEIIPQLLDLHPLGEREKELMASDEDYPRFTLVFDREAYSPVFFKHLWDSYRIAVLTYRKNVKDEWQESLFEKEKVETRLGETDMLLHEKSLLLSDCPLREVRRLSPNGHQTSIITTNRILSVALIAGYMFGRWVQENFFRYMRQEYALDKIIQYATDEIDTKMVVVNREYSKIASGIKKLREKLSRRKAELYDIQQNRAENENEKSTAKETGKWMKKQLELIEEIQLIDEDIEKNITLRKATPYQIPIEQMPPESRYCKLHQESKRFQNIIKMICYRAETALANQLAPFYARSDDEIRALMKAVIHQTIDLCPDYDRKLLNITLYPLANQRANRAIASIIDKINDTKTIYPGTDLLMKFKITTV